jgi:two-component system chemotaxis response regulator CheB
VNEIGADVSHRDLVVIGTSAGGVDTLPRLFAGIPPELSAAILVVQHLTPMSSMHLVDIVQRTTPLRVAWGEHGNRIRTGEIVIAPPGIHMVVERAQIVLAGGPRESHARPSIDVLFRSAAAHHAGRVIGVLLTGMLDDGVAGLDAIHRTGGVVVVQDPDDASFGDMPRAALAKVPVDHVAPVDAIGPLLAQLTREAPHDAPVPEDVALVAERESAEVLPEGPDPKLDLGEDQETERALWAAVRSLQQQASTLAKLARESRMVGGALASQYERRSVEAYDDANRARRFLLERQKRRHHKRRVTAARRGEAPPGAHAKRRGRRA